ncbi:MAG: gamma-glutamyltransferase [Fervidicoccaceae archaeon]
MILKVAYGRVGVAADHPLSVKIGMDVLEDGGNAFDAAIAISASLSVLQPQSGGPGGDAFLMFFRDREIRAFASYGRSFSGFDAERFIKESPTRGPLTATVPGLVALWGKINEELGLMPLEDLLQPAISLAFNGFRAGKMLANASASSEKEIGRYKWAKYFRGIREGDLVVNRDMARTLRAIVQRGWKDFYEGELAERIVGELREQGVGAELEDLRRHEAEEVKPLSLEIDGRVLYELPPSTIGVTTLHLISALHELGLDELGFGDPKRIAAWMEPIKAAYAFRDRYIGDPDHMGISVERMLKYSEIKNAAEKGLVGGRSGGDTTFFIVSDGEHLVGFIQSLFNPFGSGLIIGGFPVQNRGVGFARAMNLPNSPAPRKRPMHTLSILGIDEGDARRIIGCVGGDYRPQLHLRAYENIYVYRMGDAEALMAPRFIFSPAGNEWKVEVENGLSFSEEAGLSFVRVPLFGTHGHIHTARMDRRGVLYLASDPRTEGISMAL